MNTDRRQSFEEVKNDQRKLEERRKLIDEAMGTRDGYAKRGTKIWRNMAIVCLFLFIVCALAKFSQNYLIGTAIVNQVTGIPDIPKEIWKILNTLYMTWVIGGSSSFALGIISAGIYFFKIKQNKKEFEYELANSEEVLKNLKKYRPGDGDF